MNETIKERQDAVEDVRVVRPFYLLLVAALIFVYGVALYNNPALRAWPELAIFTGLMAAHTILHLYSPRVVGKPLLVSLYIVVQVSLAVVIIVFARDQALVFGLLIALAGEIIGLLSRWQHALIAAGGFLALIFLLLWLLEGIEAVPSWLGISVLMMAFVLIYVVLFGREMQARSEAQRLLRELEATHVQLAEYAQQVESLTLETERQRMARELHDTLAQGLAGLVLQLEGLEAHLEQGHTEKAAEIAANAKGRARTALAEARRAIADLREQPQLPLADAIGREVERFTRATGIECSLDMASDVPGSPATAEPILRCVSEGLANVAQHASANRAWVKVSHGNGTVRVEVGDDGIGFDPAAVQGGHYGLLGLRERARLAGGSLTVTSEPGQGTILVLAIPAADRVATATGQNR